MNPMFLADFYKYGHIDQYPKGVTQVWSNWTPRKTRVPGRTHAVHFGLQYFILKYLKEEFDNHFFNRPLADVLTEYIEVIKTTLGVEKPRVDHIAALWQLGRLPLAIYSLPEGTAVPMGIPAMVITNTDPRFFWLPNFLETLLSAALWKPSTSATTALEYRKLFTKYAVESGETDLSFIDWMGHDFSMRGMSGIEDAVLSGMGHLLSFNGTDTLPAILAARKYYGADLSIGGSVPATEHSVMSAGSKDGEFETFRRLIEDIYPTGIVSIVSDTWDLWKVLTEYIPALKDKILARDGKIVIRPDSGDPVKIICGDEWAYNSKHGYNCDLNPPMWGAAALLAKALGTETRYGKGDLIRNGGLIYGDSITLERADQILKGLVNQKLSPYNMVFGIGSYTYEYVTRDTNGYAMKATAVRINDEVVPIFKDPVTDDGLKKSLRGIPVVYPHLDLKTMTSELVAVETTDPSMLDNCAFEKVYEDGELLTFTRFDEIRKRVRNEVPVYQPV